MDPQTVQWQRTPVQAFGPRRDAPGSAPEEAQRRFFEMSLDLFAIIDADGRFCDVNRQWRLLGYEPGELRGASVIDFIHPEDRDKARRAGAPLNADLQATVHVDVRFRAQDGQYRWLDWTATTDPDGGLFYAVARDHTKQRDLEELSNAIVNDVEDYAIFMLDRDGHVRTWNRGAERCKGYLGQEVIGHHFSLFYPKDHQFRPLRLLKDAERDGRVEDEGWRVRKDGTRFWANVIITAVRDGDGNVVGFTKLTRDLTERRRSEEAERRAFQQAAELRQLDQLSRMRAGLLNLVAHELRTPLTPLRMQVQLLRSGRLGETTAEQDRSVAVLDRNVTRLTKLVQDILEVSRLEADKLATQPRPFHIADLLQEIHAAYGVAAQQKGIGFEVDVDAGLVGWGDPDRLQQVLYNLADNALKFTVAGRVVIRAREDDGLLVEVQDTGLGLASQDMERVFDPFVQAHQGIEDGSGLGLFIARGIVERHGGTMGCRSDGPGHGATFWFRIPLQPTDL